MPFEIRKVGSTVKKTFNIRDILRLLGDKVNDEVRIDDVSYRISSATELPTGGGSGGAGIIDPSTIPLPLVDWIRVPIPITQSGQAQGIESAGSIFVMPHVVLGIVRKMVDFDVVAHLQQLVQARGWLTGIHVNRIVRLTWRLKWVQK